MWWCFLWTFFIEKQACSAVLQSSTKPHKYFEGKKKLTEKYYTDNSAKLFVQEVLFLGAFQERYNNVVMNQNSYFLDCK